MKIHAPVTLLDTKEGGIMTIKVMDNLAGVRELLRKKKKWEAAAGEERLIELDLTLYQRKRTLKQNNLAWELCTRLGIADGVSKEHVHAAVKEITYPSGEYHGVYFTLDGSDLTTEQYSVVLETLILWCLEHDPPVDIRDIWVLFYEWRYAQPYDPLSGRYRDMDDYREKHPCCEACCRYLISTNEAGNEIHTGHMAHIVSKGAGAPEDGMVDGKFDDTLFLMLCSEHHRGVQHQKGWDLFVKMFPFLWAGIARCQNKYNAKVTPDPMRETRDERQAEATRQVGLEDHEDTGSDAVEESSHLVIGTPSQGKQEMLDTIGRMERAVHTTESPDSQSGNAVASVPEPKDPEVPAEDEKQEELEIY